MTDEVEIKELLLKQRIYIIVITSYYLLANTLPKVNSKFKALLGQHGTIGIQTKENSHFVVSYNKL